jgi:chromosome partitioning protein
MRIIAIINQKGGVGKTTSAVNIAAGLARAKKRVMLLDLDPQAHLTQSLGINADQIKLTIYDLLKIKKRGDRQAALPQAIIERDGLALIPSIIDLAGAEMEFAGVPGRELLLKESMELLAGYDYILLDCPPSLGLLTLNALTTADELFIPVQTHYLALQGMSQLIDTIELVERRLNKGVAITGVIGTMFDRRKLLHREAAERLRQYFGRLVMKTFIRENIALAEAPSHGQTIFEYRPESHGAEDYWALTKEILARAKVRS